MAKHKTRAEKALRRKGKKYSPAKSFEMAMDKAVFLSFDSESENGDRVCVTNIASMKIRDAVIAFRRDWLITIGAIGRDDAGQIYVEEVQILLKDSLINDATEAYQRYSAEVVQAINPRHLIDRGWIIRPWTQRLERRIQAERHKALIDSWQERQRNQIKRLENFAA